jgi:hypothetical protein
MTEDEILKAFKGEAVHLDKAQDWDQLNLYASIGINNYDINGDKYNVYFAMDKTAKTLKMIQIYAADKQYGLFQMRFKNLEPIFTEKYGAPSVVAWYFPSTKIELQYMDYSLMITYSVPRGKDKI